MDKKSKLKGITDAEVDAINDKLRARRLPENGGEGNMYLEVLKGRDIPTGSFEFLKFNGNTGKLKNREKYNPLNSKK
jgi:hypothetical protein